MRIEITEKRLSDMDPDTGQLYVQHKGDVVTVPDVLGAKWCALGWARDIEHKVKAGPRIPRDVIVQPDSARHVAIDSNLKKGH